MPQRGRFVELGTFRPKHYPPRPVRMFVPAAARTAAASPLLVLFDGQNVFGDELSYAGGWHAHEAVAAIHGRTFAAPIVVGVGNGGTRRLDELGRDVRFFVDAVVHDVLAPVLARFAIAGPARRAIGGSSLGGLAALYALLMHPEAFGEAMAMSPSLWLGRRAFLRELSAGNLQIPTGSRIYLDAGGRERGRMFADAEHLAAMLAHRLPASDLMWRPDKRGTHHERHWRRRLPKALRFLFRRPVGD